MNEKGIKRTTANLPHNLLKRAQGVTKAGITETLILGLQLVARTIAYEKAQELRGKIKLNLSDIDLAESRERNNC